MVNSTKEVTHSLEELERKHVDESMPFSNDISFFYVSDNSGNAFICRMAFRRKKRNPEAWFNFFLPGIRIGNYRFNNSPGLRMIEFGFNKEKYGQQLTEKIINFA
jgi:hypothetical protein